MVRGGGWGGQDSSSSDLGGLKVILEVGFAPVHLCKNAKEIKQVDEQVPTFYIKKTHSAN